MFPVEQIETYASRLAALEKEEPVVCAWRYEGGPSPEERFRTLRRLKRKLWGVGWGLKALARPRPGQIVVLVHAATPAHWGSVRPVLEALKERGRPVFLVTRSATLNLLEGGLFDGHAVLEELLRVPSRHDRIATGRRASALANILAQLLSPYPAGLSESWLTQGLLCRAAAREWLGDAGLVLADCDIEAWRKGLILGANDIGVPSVVLQHGLFGPVHFPVHARFLFAWGRYFCRDAERYGLEGVTCEPVGCPRWDCLREIREAPRNRDLLLRLGVDPEKPVVLLISNAHGARSHPQHYRAYFEGVRRLIDSRFQVLLRLHPAERGLEHYVGRIPDHLLESVAVCPPDVDLHGCLKAADVVYHVFSAAAIEAMALGVPVLFERGKPGEKLCGFPDHQGGMWVSPDSLADLCRRLLFEETLRKKVVEAQVSFVESALASIGEATETTVRRLESLCNEACSRGEPGNGAQVGRQAYRTSRGRVSKDTP